MASNNASNLLTQLTYLEEGDNDTVPVRLQEVLSKAKDCTAEEPSTMQMLWLSVTSTGFIHVVNQYVYCTIIYINTNSGYQHFHRGPLDFNPDLSFIHFGLWAFS